MKNVVPILFLLLFLIVFISCENSNSNTDNEPEIFANAIEEYGQLSVVGNKIVDQNGNPVQLRGVSLFWSQWIGKYYTPEVVKWLKDDWQCNVIRTAMAVDYAGYLENPEIEKAKVKTVIDATITEGIYVIVDWHDHEAQDHLAEAKIFFSEIAEEYGDYPNIIYETYNEPLNVSWNSILKPYHEAIITEIRAYDSDNIVICGTPNWSQDVDDVIGNMIDDDNIAYSLHYYAATHKQFFRDKAQLALDNNIPLFVTEYGTTQASGDIEIDVAESELWWQFLDDNKISHCNWSIADKEEMSAALKPNTNTTGNWTVDDLTISGIMVRAEIKAKNKQY